MVSGNSSGGMTTISGLTKEVYTVEVAAQISAGTGPIATLSPFRLLTVSDYILTSTPTMNIIVIQTDVYLSLNGDIIPNHGYVLISDIGFTDDTALLCHTNFLL